jgi:hypothetical protein
MSIRRAMRDTRNRMPQMKPMNMKRKEKQKLIEIVKSYKNKILSTYLASRIRSNIDLIL